MADVLVAHDAEGTALAKRVHDFLRAAGHSARFEGRSSFPTGDGMLSFLWGLQSQAPAILVISSSDPASAWLFPELLKYQRPGVALVVADAVPIPSAEAVSESTILRERELDDASIGDVVASLEAGAV